MGGSKIKQITDNNIFLEICDKLDDIKKSKCRITKNMLYNLMIGGQYNKKVFTYVSYDGKKMNGCAVIFIDRDIFGDLILSIIFQWRDSHYFNLWKDYMNFIEQKSKEFKVKRINFSASRNEKAIDRQLCKYNYKKVYSIYEKEMV